MLRAHVNAKSCCGRALSCLCVNCECDAESSCDAHAHVYKIYNDSSWKMWNANLIPKVVVSVWIPVKSCNHELSTY
jgi:hypothetical protein